MTDILDQLDEVEALVRSKHQPGQHDQGKHAGSRGRGGGAGVGSMTSDQEALPATGTAHVTGLKRDARGDVSFLKDKARRDAYTKIDGYYQRGHGMSMHDALRSELSPTEMKPFQERDALQRDYDKSYGKRAYGKDSGTARATSYIKPMRQRGMVLDKKGNTYGGIQVKQRGRWNDVGNVGNLRSGDPLRGYKYKNWNARGGWQATGNR